MARKLSPEEATLLIIRRRLQQVEAAKKTDKKKEADKPQPKTGKRSQSLKPD